MEKENKLFALFLGWKQQLNPEERFFEDWFDGLNRVTEGNKKPLLFPYSWELLLKVVQKIYDIEEGDLTNEAYEIQENLAFANKEGVYEAIVIWLKKHNNG